MFDSYLAFFDLDLILRDLTSLEESGLLCNPSTGVLETWFLAPLENQRFPDKSDLYEYIFLISEDTYELIDELDSYSDELFAYLIVLLVYCERFHEWNQFYSGKLLASFLDRLQILEVKDLNRAIFFCDFISELYEINKITIEDLYEFKFLDETLLVVYLELIRITGIKVSPVIDNLIIDDLLEIIFDLPPFEKNVLWETDAEFTRIIGMINKKIE